MLCLTLDGLDHFIVFDHIDGIVVGWAAEITRLRRRRVSQCDAEAAADALIDEDCTHPAAVLILFFNDAVFDRAGRLAY